MRAEPEYARPKPVRSDVSTLGRLLLALEKSRCKCPDDGQPCRHVRGLARRFPTFAPAHLYLLVHDLMRRLVLMRKFDQAGYDGPDLPAPSVIPLTPRGKALLLRERASGNLALHNPHDARRIRDTLAMAFNEDGDLVDARDHEPEDLPDRLRDLWYADEATANDLLMALRDEQTAKGDEKKLADLAAVRRGKRVAELLARRQEIERAFGEAKGGGK